MAQKSGELSTLLRLGAGFGHGPRSELVYRKCIAQYPEDFRAYFNLASQLAGQPTKQEEAVQLLEEANRLAPHVVEVYANLAGLQIKRGRAAEAAEWCERGLTLDPGNSECLYNLNVALRQEGRMREALERSWERLGHLLSSSSSSSSAEKSEDSLPRSPQPPPLAQAASAIKAPLDPALDVAFVCVKWGTKYGSEYVNALYGGLQRHYWSCPHYPSQSQPLLVCLTDDPSGVRPEVQVSLLPDSSTSAWRGWWLKGHLFGNWVDALLPAAPTTFVFLDLDTVLCGPLRPCIEPLVRKAIQTGAVLSLQAGQFKASEGRDEGINSSILVWRNDSSTSSLFGFLEKHYQAVTSVVYKFDHYLEMMLLSHTRHVAVDEAWPCPPFIYVPNEQGAIVDFSSLSGTDRALPPNAAIVCFPLLPKPHQVAESVPWIKEHWKP